jgi:flagellar basal body-associated protein FliL
MKLEKSDAKLTGIMVICIGIVIGLLLYYYYHHKQDLGIKLSPLSSSSPSKPIETVKKTSYTRLRLTLATGGRTGLAVNVAIPYDDIKQRSQIYKNMVRIENDFVVKYDQQMIYQLATKKKFSELKKIFLSIINSYVDKPIKKIYFEDFFILG